MWLRYGERVLSMGALVVEPLAARRQVLGATLNMNSRIWRGSHQVRGTGTQRLTHVRLLTATLCSFVVESLFSLRHLLQLTTVGLGDITPITPLGRAIACGSVLSGAFLVPLQLGSLARATMSEMSRPNPTAPPPAVPPNSLLAQLGDYGMVDLDAADSAAAPPPPAAALAAAPPGVVPRPLATAAAAVVAVPAAAAVAAATAAGPASRAWNAAFMDAPCNSCGLRVHQLDARYCRLCGTVLQSPPRV